MVEAHPYAFKNKNAYIDQEGNVVRAGDRVRDIIDGTPYILNEALPDGDAFVTCTATGGHNTLKWRHLVKIKN